MATDKLSTYNPTVLIVEDDRTCGRYLRQQFHNNTSVGVVLAGNIRAGRRLSKEIRFDAIISDLFFDDGTDCPEEDLYDGVDLAAAIRSDDPDVPTYFLSFFSDDTALQLKAKAKNVEPVAWLQKSFVRPKAGDMENSPWKRVEFDLLKESLSLEERSEILESDDLDLALRLRHPIRTYIQELSDSDLTVKKPIEVICTLDEGLAKASAPAIGLLEDGFGDTVQESLDQLADLIQSHFKWLNSPEVQTADYAEAVREQLLSRIERTTS